MDCDAGLVFHEYMELGARTRGRIMWVAGCGMASMLVRLVSTTEDRKRICDHCHLMVRLRFWFVAGQGVWYSGCGLNDCVDCSATDAESDPISYRFWLQAGAVHGSYQDWSGFE